MRRLVAAVLVWGWASGAWAQATPTPVIAGSLTVAQQYTAPTGINSARFLLAIGGKLFVGSNSNPCHILRFNNEADLTDVTIYDFLDAGHAYCSQAIYDAGTGRLYITFASVARLVVSVFNPTTLTYYDLVNTNSYIAGNGPGIASDGVYLYVATTTVVLKFRIADGAQVAASGSTISAEPVVYDGTHVWVGSVLGTPSTFYEFNTDLSDVGNGSFATGQNGVADDVAATVDSTNLWFGFFANTNLLSYVNRATRTPTTWDMGTGPSYGVFESAGYVFSTTGINNGTVVRIDPSGPTGAIYNFTGATVNKPSEMVRGTATGAYFFATTTSPLTVNRVAAIPGISTFTPTPTTAVTPTPTPTPAASATPTLLPLTPIPTVDSWTSLPGAGSTHCMFTARGKLWVPTMSTPPRIYRFNTPDVSLANYDAGVWSSPDKNHRSAMACEYDPGTDLIYMLLLGTGMRVVKVNPDTLAMTDFASDDTVPGTWGGLANDGTNLYVSSMYMGGTVGNYMRKYRLSDGVLVAANNSTYQQHVLLWDGSNLWGSGQGSLTNNELLHWNTTTLVPTPTTFTNTGLVTHVMNHAFPSDQANDATWILAGHEGTTGHLTLVNKSTLALTDVNLGISAGAAATVKNKSAYLWALMGGVNPAVIARIAPSPTPGINLYGVDVAGGDGGVTDANNLAFDQWGNAYVSRGNPASGWYTGALKIMRLGALPGDTLLPTWTPTGVPTSYVSPTPTPTVPTATPTDTPTVTPTREPIDCQDKCSAFPSTSWHVPPTPPSNGDCLRYDSRCGCWYAGACS